MLAPELADELRMIAYAPMAKPVNRVGALASLMRNGLDSVKVRDTLYSLATDCVTPDSVKIRAIDLLDKYDLSAAPTELSHDQQATLTETLMQQYVGNS